MITDVSTLVFIGGISGVGKTTLLDRSPGRDREWLRMSAGRLIAGELGLAALSVEDEADVLRCQDALVRAYKQRSRGHALPILMDGHFTLHTRSGAIAVPESVFRALAPHALVLLHAPPDEIRSRRLHRDGAAPSLEELAAAASAEAAAARAIAGALRLPLHELSIDADPAAALLGLMKGVSS